MPYDERVTPRAELPGPLAVRTMTPGDIPRVSEIEQASFASGWPATSFRQELERNNLARYLVVECATPAGPDVTAFGGLWLQVDEAHIVTVAVRPEFRRHGIADVLVHALLDLAVEEGMQQATLEVRESNTAARALYKKHGFYEVGERKRYYQDGEDARIMTTEEFASAGFRRHYERIAALLAARFEAVRPTAGE